MRAVQASLRKADSMEPARTGSNKKTIYLVRERELVWRMVLVSALLYVDITLALVRGWVRWIFGSVCRFDMEKRR